MNRKRLIVTFALTTLLSGGLARAQAPAGYELALVRSHLESESRTGASIGNREFEASRLIARA